MTANINWVDACSGWVTETRYLDTLYHCAIYLLIMELTMMGEANLDLIPSVSQNLICNVNVGELIGNKDHNNAISFNISAGGKLTRKSGATILNLKQGKI